LPIDLLKPTFHPRGGYLAFLGRISPEKGVEPAIRIARALGIPLKIAAKVDEEYFRIRIKPLLDGAGVEFVVEINEAAKGEFLGEARSPCCSRSPGQSRSVSS
jgi:glycosyltransferase involved in cell wall biosynthesis